MGDLGPVPPHIDNEEHIFDFKFSPHDDIFAFCDVLGDVHVYKYSLEATELVDVLEHHDETVRRIAWHPTHSSALYSASVDKHLALADAATKQILWQVRGAHDEPINAILGLNEHLVATGCDAGIVKVWDTRVSGDASPVHEFEEHEDYVSSLAFHKNRLLSAAGDGRLAVYNPFTGRMVARSDEYDAEYLSMAIVGEQVVLGTTEGTLAIFKWGDWGDMVDRFPGHPGSIDALCSLDKHYVLTGADDGLVRALGIFPNRLYGVLGDHGELAIEQLEASRNKNLLASIGHDNCIRFHSLADFNEDEDNEEAAVDPETVMAQAMATGGEFEEEDMDSEDEEAGPPPNGAISFSNPGAGKKAFSKPGSRPDPRNAFFKDME